MINVASLLAVQDAGQSTVADGVRYLTNYEWSRASQFEDPRYLWLLVAAVSLLAIVYVGWFYQREKDALATWQRLLLPALRLIAVAGAIVFFLGPEKRIDVQEAQNSRVTILVDTSQSMSVEDETSQQNTRLARSEVVRKALEDSKLVDSLREKHVVSIAAFDLQTRTLAELSRLSKESSKAKAKSTPEANWEQGLHARGQETRLGNALEHVLDKAEKERTGPLAGVIVISDGGNNSGADPLKVADRAETKKVPIYTVGVGSTTPRRNLRVQQLSVPARAYPDDKTKVRGLIHGEGFQGRTVNVELFALSAEDPSAKAVFVERQPVEFVADTELVPVEFDLEPTEVGRMLLDLRIVAPTDDQYAQDNHREAELEVVEAQTKVLLIASGPTRDYRFLRNQLRRDSHSTVDVLLQSALPGVSQDADKLLAEFPNTREELYEYDCIVAFDPDWTQLDAFQVDLLESWVAEEAGGLIVVAGPIHTYVWSQSAEHMKIRSLYPVEFQRRLSLLDDGIYGSETARKIIFSSEGQQSEFLWLAESAAESRSLWNSLKVVFGCYAVKGPKPGARVLGRYGNPDDPDDARTDNSPVYIAEHFYGGGRVLYIGSAEMWRLRSFDLSYFDILYTKMIRHVSQGRLLRGSASGQLLVERETYSVGDEVVVRARLTTSSREPLLVDRVTAGVIDPSGKSKTLVLNADANRPGNYVGQFDLRREGSHRILLSDPGSMDEPLSQLVQAVAPDLEFEKTRRDEELLSNLARRTVGRYYSNLQLAVQGTSDVPAIASVIDSQTEFLTRHGTPDKEFEERVNMILLGVICGALSCEWLLRRLLRLA